MRFTSIVAALAVSGALLLCGAASLRAQKHEIVWSEQEKPIYEKLHKLRDVPDAERGRVIRDLALRIRRLPVTLNKLNLATGLAGLSTEGDFGRENLQEVANTLADALREQHAPPEKNGEPGMPYVELAELKRYEHVKVSLDDPQFAAAMSQLEKDDEARAKANFTLTDLSGKSWTLRDLRGKVVVVNFWATWCPPCRKEMPDLNALYQRYKDDGLVVLAISDEDAAKVQPFIAERHISYPILLDAGRKVNDEFRIDGIPKTFVYNRDGRLVAEAMDMRTRNQF